MGILSRLFGRKEAQSSAETEVADRPCPHAAIVPHWEGAADIGKRDLVSSYACESCGDTFSREEGERLLNEAAEGLRVSEADRL